MVSSTQTPITVRAAVIDEAAVRQEGQGVEEGVDLEGGLVDGEHHGALPVAEPVGRGRC